MLVPVLWSTSVPEPLIVSNGYHLRSKAAASHPRLAHFFDSYSWRIPLVRRFPGVDYAFRQFRCQTSR